MLKWVNPPIMFTQLSSWVTGNGLKRDYVSWDELSYNIKLAAISSEDQLFPDHSGFDWKSIEKAMKYNERKPNRIKGASTISQQVAKNVFFMAGKKLDKKRTGGLFYKNDRVDMGEKKNFTRIPQCDRNG